MNPGAQLDAISIMGTVTASFFAVDNPLAERADARLRDASNLSALEYRALLAELQDAGGFKRSSTHKNLVVTSGRAVLARLLAGDATYSGAISYGALGSGSTSPAVGNTQLATETFRKLYANRQQSSASATIDFYYSKGDTNGTYNEFGCFIDGTGTANSGQLFNRVLTGGWTKSASEAMTVSVQFDLNSS